MRVHLCVVGRAKGGPEHTLIEDYLARFDKAGRRQGLSLGRVIEVEDRRGGGRPAEAVLLRKARPENAVMWCLDERGTVVSSPDFAQRLAAERDRGQGDLVFVIGGADGIDPGLREDATWSLSFGQMVWPHMLARVMLAEQLYRAATILAGGPYHRA